MQTRYLVATPLALAVAATLALPAYAASASAVDAAAVAEASADSPTELDSVEVVGHRPDGYATSHTRTATRTRTPLRDVPQAITVVSQELIKDQAMRGLADIVTFVPGATMAQGEGNRDTPILRGNGSTSDMFVDGIRDDVQYFRDLYNIDRVEVLKGPNAMVFGRGGAGGVINRVAKQADWNETREATLQGGSWNRRRLTTDVADTLGDAMAFRVTALYEDSESFRDGFENERWGINPTLAFKAGNSTRIVVGYEHFEDDRVADRGLASYFTPFDGRRLPVDTDPSTFFGDPDNSPVTADVDALTAGVEHAFGNGVQLRNRTRVADYDKFYQNVYPGDAARVNAQGQLEVAIKAYSNATDRRNVFNQTDLEFAATTGSIRHTLLAGAELGRQETDNFRMTGAFPSNRCYGAVTTSSFCVPVANPRYSGPVTFAQSATDANNHSVARVAGLYVQDQLEFSPQWQAILGLRYDRFDVDFRNNRNGATLEATDNLWSPRAGLVYKPLESLSLYGSYSIAHLPRAGEQLSSLTVSNSTFDPEKFENYELGAKWDLRQNLALTAAVYRLDRSNVIVPDPVDPTRSILVDGQRSEGVEIGLAGDLTDAWRVMGTYAWQGGEVLAGADRGKRLAQLPEQTASLWNRYDFTPMWGVGLGVIHRGEMFASLSNAVTLKSYTRYDAAVYFEPTDTIAFQLNLENLFDKQYFTSAHSDTNISPGSPRAAYLSMTVKF